MFRFNKAPTEINAHVSQNKLCCSLQLLWPCISLPICLRTHCFDVTLEGVAMSMSGWDELKTSHRVVYRTHVSIGLKSACHKHPSICNVFCRFSRRPTPFFLNFLGAHFEANSSETQPLGNFSGTSLCLGNISRNCHVTKFVRCDIGMFPTLLPCTDVLPMCLFIWCRFVASFVCKAYSKHYL